ncbi:HD-GYP domain-containing protein [Telmatospirillum siberiense]|nr:HD domain-containing phosphohydrolase [Telmatospirillum siberiense]
MRYLISLDDAVRALASAVDLVGTDEVHHGKRVALMASTLAERLGWPLPRRIVAHRAAMLHDCGVSRSTEHHELIAQMEWPGAEAHCVRGADYLSGVPAFRELAPIVRWHHQRWCEMPSGLDKTIAETANLIFMADRMDALRAQYQVTHHPAGINRLMTALNAERGRLFHPDFVDLAEDVSRSEAFWFSLEPDAIEFSLDIVPLPHDRHALNWHEMHALSVLFARIIDAKSEFTADHSLHVGALSRLLAALMGLPRQRCGDVELAGLLHDLGKLRVPDEVLDKQGSLDLREKRVMARHSFETHVLLRRLFGDHPLADWAAWHHENLLGTGYPFRRKELPIEARIIAIADIFQALLQDRPYRRGKRPDEAMAILADLAAKKRIDGTIVQIVAAHLDVCVQAATGKSPRRRWPSFERRTAPFLLAGEIPQSKGARPRRQP